MSRENNTRAEQLVQDFVKTEERIVHSDDADHQIRLRKDRAKILKKMHDYVNNEMRDYTEVNPNE